MPTLDLSNYDEQKTFDAIPAGKYFVNIFDAEDRETAGGENAKMPAGTAMIFLHCQVTGKVGETGPDDENYEFYNRRLFRNLTVPPEGYDEKKSRAMRGMIVALYQAVGVPTEQITTPGFEYDTEDLIEKKLVVQVSRVKDKFNEGQMKNEIQGFFSIESAAGAEAAEAASIL